MQCPSSLSTCTPEPALSAPLSTDPVASRLRAVSHVRLSPGHSDGARGFLNFRLKAATIIFGVTLKVYVEICPYSLGSLTATEARNLAEAPSVAVGRASFLSLSFSVTCSAE